MRSLVTSLFVLLSPVCLRADEQVLLRASEGWKTILEKTSVLNARLKIERSSTPNAIVDVYYVTQKGFGKFEEEGKCLFQNADALYQLRKVEGQWQLVRATPLTAVEVGQRMDRPGYYNVRAITMVGNKSLLELASSRDYKFEKWTDAEDGMSCCTIRYIGSESSKPFIEAELRLNPAHYYRLESLSYTKLLAGNEGKGQHEFKYGTSSFVPDSIIETWHRGSKESVTTTRYVSVSHDPLPEDQFSLSHYGLGELGPPHHISNLLLAVIGVLAVCAVVFAVRFVRRPAIR